MPLAEIEQHRVDKLLSDLITRKAPAFTKAQIRITTTTRGNKVTLIEERPYFQDPTRWTEHKIAQFEYDQSSKKWNLYCYDGKLKRHPYPNGNKSSLDKLVEEVIKDPTGIFWG